jgi:uncharacterized glyoxalase superfamily protein PhnB
MLTSLTPMLGVTDVQRSLDFNADALGFQETGRLEHDGTLGWVHIVSGKTELMLTRMNGIESGRGGRKQLILYFYPDDVLALHASLKERGQGVTDLRVTSYRMKEFELEDPDGYQLWFGEDADEPRQPA